MWMKEHINDKCQNTASDSVMHKLCGYFSWWTIAKLKSQTCTGNSNAVNYPETYTHTHIHTNTQMPPTNAETVFDEDWHKSGKNGMKDVCIENVQHCFHYCATWKYVAPEQRTLRHSARMHQQSFRLVVMCNDKWITWNGSLFCA